MGSPTEIEVSEMTMDIKEALSTFLGYEVRDEDVYYKSNSHRPDAIKPAVKNHGKKIKHLGILKRELHQCPNCGRRHWILSVFHNNIYNTPKTVFFCSDKCLYAWAGHARPRDGESE